MATLLRSLSTCAVILCLAYGVFALPVRGRSVYGHIRESGRGKLDLIWSRMKAGLEAQLGEDDPKPLQALTTPRSGAAIHRAGLIPGPSSSFGESGSPIRASSTHRSVPPPADGSVRRRGTGPSIATVSRFRQAALLASPDSHQHGAEHAPPLRTRIDERFPVHAAIEVERLLSISHNEH